MGIICKKGVEDMNKPALKDSFIFGMSLVPEMEGLKDNKVIIVTAAGIISGVPYASVTEENGEDPSAIMFDTVLKKLKSETSGSDGALHLTDAVMRDLSGNTVNIGNIVIFHDQIIGVTLGNIN